jgi:hypothetical protein
LISKITATQCNGIKVFGVNAYTHPQKAALKFPEMKTFFNIEDEHSPPAGCLLA